MGGVKEIEDDRDEQADDGGDCEPEENNDEAPEEVDMKACGLEDRTAKPEVPESLSSSPDELSWKASSSQEASEPKPSFKTPATSIDAGSN